MYMYTYIDSDVLTDIQIPSKGTSLSGRCRSIYIYIYIFTEIQTPSNGTSLSGRCRSVSQKQPSSPSSNTAGGASSEESESSEYASPSPSVSSSGCGQTAEVRIAFPGSFSRNRFSSPISALFLTRVDDHSYSLLTATGKCQELESHFQFVFHE